MKITAITASGQVEFTDEEVREQLATPTLYEEGDSLLGWMIRAECVRNPGMGLTLAKEEVVLTLSQMVFGGGEHTVDVRC